jgi:two-component system CheB/CheR fusion protein
MGAKQPSLRQSAALLSGIRQDLIRIDAALANPDDSGMDPFPAAVRATRMPIVVTNPRRPDNVVVFVNDAFCRLTGYARPEILGRNCRFLQGPDTDPDAVRRIRRAVHSGEPIELDIRNYRRNREPFWNRLHIVPLHDPSGELVYLFASQIDITVERERLEALEWHNRALLAERSARQDADLANAAKSRFLAVASHDIRQPIQTLVLLQGLLLKMVRGQAAEKLVDRMGHTLDSMSGMLGTLLNLSQLEAGAVLPRIACFPINDIFERLTSDFVLAAEAKGLRLRIVPCRLMVTSDPDLLEQMLRNLLGNALKYTRKGKILLGCRRSGAKLQIEIWDTGIGIAKDQLDDIFREYHQLDNASRKSSRGVGLGLSIVQRLGQLLAHPTRVRSTPGKGSVFTVEVMRTPQSARPAPAKSTRAGAG